MVRAGAEGQARNGQRIRELPQRTQRTQREGRFTEGDERGAGLKVPGHGTILWYGGLAG
jgi:hypothetical protein